MGKLMPGITSYTPLNSAGVPNEYRTIPIKGTLSADIKGPTGLPSRYTIFTLCPALGTLQKNSGLRMAWTSDSTTSISSAQPFFSNL